MDEILKKYKCIEYGIQYDKDNNPMLFLVEDGCGFMIEDTAENTNRLGKEFEEWKKSFDTDDNRKCVTCCHKYECKHYC